MSEILSSLDQAFEKAIQDGVYAGGVAFARNKSGMGLREGLTLGLATDEMYSNRYIGL